MTRMVSGSIALLMAFSIQLATAHVADAADNSGSHLCLLNASAFCADLKDDSFALNQPVYIWNKTSGNGLGWNRVFLGDVCSGSSCGSPWPFKSGSGFNTKYAGSPVYLFQKTLGNNSHDGCLGETGGSVVLRDCPNEGNDSSGTLWVLSNFIDPNFDSTYTSVLDTDTTGTDEFLTAASNSDGSAMFLSDGVDWEQWVVE